MLRRRRRPPVLAEVSALRSGQARPGALDRAELAAFADLSQTLGGSRAVLVTGGGKSRVALGLAAAAAVAGKRVVLLECDLERPALAGSLGLAGGPGLHEYLRREVEAEQILQSLVLAGPASAGATAPLVCIVAGRPATSSAPLLTLEDFDHAVEKLRRAYDLAILDGPPLSGDRDSLRAVAGPVDATLVCGGRTEIPKKPPIPVTGFVVQD